MSCKIYKRSSYYQVIFRKNGVLKQSSKKLEKDAIEIANKFDFEYYSSYPEHLPKGISICSRDSNFRLEIINPNKTSGKIYISNYTTVAEANAARLKILKSLIDI